MRGFDCYDSSLALGVFRSAENFVIFFVKITLRILGARINHETEFLLRKHEISQIYRPHASAFFIIFK